MSSKSKVHQKPTNQSHRDPFPEPRTMPGKWDTSGMSSQERDNRHPKKNPEGGEDSPSEETQRKNWEASELTSWYNR